MVRMLIGWALNNPLVVLTLTLALAIFGVYSFLHVNVEAYPDPAPPLIEVIAQFPGGSAEEVERQVTVPLEVTLAGMPGLKATRSKSLFGLSDIKCQFEYGTDYLAARQEVINRLQFTQPLPPGVTPQLSPESPTGEIYRYTLNSPKDSSGNPIYTLSDLKALQDWVLEREFRRVPRIVDVTSFGGTVKRYEIHPDPDRMKAFGINLSQLQSALSNANANVGGDYVIQGAVAMNVRGVGLFGAGQDPVNRVLGMDTLVMDAYQDACFAEFLHLIPADQKEKIWQLLVERHTPRPDDPNNPAPKKAEPVPAELEQRVATLERLRRGVDRLAVDPPLSAEEQKQAFQLRRLRTALAGGDVKGLFDDQEKRELDPKLVEELTRPLGKEEKEQVEAVRRILSGFPTPDIRPVVEEPGRLDRIGHFFGSLVSSDEKPNLGEEEQTERAALRNWVGRRASDRLREEEGDRIREIRSIVVTSINNRDILVEDLVEGGRLNPGELAGVKGVVVGQQTRLGRVSQARPLEKRTVTGIYRVVDAQGKPLWRDEVDKVQCIVLLRKGEDSLPALKDIEAKVKELNDPTSGKMLPGVYIEPYYDRTDLINITTDTVHENLAVGISLVVVILFMFISNVRAAIIVAINIPLALLVAFSLLFIRGKSANLLSIGAVDFGIIVDSSVIMVENIYRHLASGDHSHLPLKDRILKSSREIDRALLFSTAIMVCAFLPLFTMSGPEGQLFGPMADTYAFSLGGALLLATTTTPVLCMLFFKNMKPIADNFLVAWLKRRYLTQLDRCMRYRWLTVGLMTALMVATGFLLPHLGREFMPELEEGNLWVRGRFPLNISLERVTENADEVRSILCSYPEVETAVVQIGRPDDGTDTDGFYNMELFVPVRPQEQWPKTVEETGWRRWLHGAKRARTKEELVNDMNAELSRKIPGADFNFSQNIRDNVMESLSGVKGDNSVKIIGPDLDKLDDLAEKFRDRLREIKGIENVGVFSIKGQTNMEFRVDLEKCKKWGVSANDVNTVIQTALGGKAYSTMIEGEKQFDITVRWPKWRRGSETAVLDIPVDIVNNQLIMASGPSATPSPTGSSILPPSKGGSQLDTSNPITNTPRKTLRDLVSPLSKDGTRSDPNGSFVRSGASTIYREQGKRLIAVKFSIRGRDLGSAVSEAREKTRDLFQAPYRADWSGEFEEMEAAEGKLLWIVPLSLGLIFVLLYAAFRSFLDAIVVFSNVLALGVGGLWALWFTHTNFSISAAVGFISLFGVAIMDGLLLISSFNANRAHGLPLRDAILQGAAKRVRPVTMTALTAVLGLLPAALSTKIGAQTQRPLAIIVVGGMLTTLFLTRYLMPVLYTFYGNREPPEGSGDLAH